MTEGKEAAMKGTEEAQDQTGSFLLGSPWPRKHVHAKHPQVVDGSEAPSPSFLPQYILKFMATELLVNIR
jgi:hypothetical protein